MNARLLASVRLLERRARAAVTGAIVRRPAPEGPARIGRISSAPLRLAAERARLSRIDALAAERALAEARATWQKWARLSRGLARRQNENGPASKCSGTCEAGQRPSWFRESDHVQA